MASAQQHFSGTVNSKAIPSAVAEATEAAERWRKRGELILATLERGDVEALEEANRQELDQSLDEAIDWGLTLREVVLSPRCAEMAAMMERLFAARTNPKDWALSRTVALELGQHVEVWCAEYRDGTAHLVEPRGNLEVRGDPPPLAVLLRAVRDTLAGLEPGGSDARRLVATPDQAAAPA